MTSPSIRICAAPQTPERVWRRVLWASGQKSLLLAAGVVFLLTGQRAVAKPLSFRLVVDAGMQARAHTPVTVAITLPEALKGETAAQIADAQGASIPGQVTSPRLLCKKPVHQSGFIARELTFILPALDAGQQKEFTVRIGEPVSGVEPSEFRWSTGGESVTELRYDGRPVLQYVHQPHDASTKQSRIETSKVYHHLFDPTGQRLLTKGSGGEFPHQVGIFYGYRNIAYDNGRIKANTWYGADGEYESHEAFQSVEAGPVLGRHCVAIDWHNRQGEVFAHELRELTAYRCDKAALGTLIEFASRLSTAGGAVKLDGNPQHAGVHFRAAQEVAAKTKNLTYFIRPDGVGQPGEMRSWDAKTPDPLCVNLPWLGMSFVLGSERYTIAYLDHPENPKEARYGERDYGRFGSYFECDLTPEKPLEVRYRFWAQSGEMAGADIAKLAADFAHPPAVMVQPLD